MHHRRVQTAPSCQDLVKGSSRRQRRLAQDNQLPQRRQSRGIDLPGRTPRGFRDNLAEHRLVIGPEESVQRHEGDGLGVVQGILQLHPARPRAERHHERPDQGAAEGGGEPLGAIAHQEGDRLPGAMPRPQRPPATAVACA